MSFSFFPFFLSLLLPLADWLPEYFFKTTEGTWRPPVNEQERREQKTALRQTGTLRRIKRFANALIDGVPVSSILERGSLSLP